MSRTVQLHGGQCIDDSRRGPGIHTTYRLGNVKIGFTWHLSPSDSHFAIKECIAQLRRVLKELGLHEHRDELFCMMPSLELYQLEQDLLNQLNTIEEQCIFYDRVA